MNTWESPRNALSIPKCSHHDNRLALAHRLLQTAPSLPANTRPLMATGILQQPFSADDTVCQTARAYVRNELADILAHNHALGLLDLDTSSSSLKESSSEKHLPVKRVLRATRLEGGLGGRLPTGGGLRAVHYVSRAAEGASSFPVAACRLPACHPSPSCVPDSLLSQFRSSSKIQA